MKGSFKLKRNKQESTAVICTLTEKDEEKQEAKETYEVANQWSNCTADGSASKEGRTNLSCFSWKSPKVLC